LRVLFKENPSAIKNITSPIKYLKQAARLGDGLSHFFLYSIYKNGIGMDKNLLKVWEKYCKSEKIRFVLALN